MANLSLIVTTYRRPVELSRALSSVYNQKLPSGVDVELIVVDDDPTNPHGGAVGQVPSWLSYRYFRRSAAELGGVALSRNKGIVCATGKYIAFLDDDDELEDGALYKLIFAANHGSLDFVAGQWRRFTEGKVGDVKISHQESLAGFSYQKLLLANQIAVGSFLIRRDAIQKYFDSGMATHEDWLFLLDNLHNLRIGVVLVNVLRVNQREGDPAVHRNSRLGSRQKWLDFSAIYDKHPAPDLLEIRKRILAGLEHTNSIGGGVSG